MLLFNLPFMGVRTSLWWNELINRYNFTDIPEKRWISFSPQINFCQRTRPLPELEQRNNPIVNEYLKYTVAKNINEARKRRIYMRMDDEWFEQKRVQGEFNVSWMREGEAMNHSYYGKEKWCRRIKDLKRCQKNNEKCWTSKQRSILFKKASANSSTGSVHGYIHGDLV